MYFKSRVLTLLVSSNSTPCAATNLAHLRVREFVEVLGERIRDADVVDQDPDVLVDDRRAHLALKIDTSRQQSSEARQNQCYRNGRGTTHEVDLRDPQQKQFDNNC